MKMTADIYDNKKGILLLRTGFILLLALAVLTTALPAYGKDGSFRCGNTYIDKGDSRARVFHYCGKPYLREIVGYTRVTENEELIEYAIEVWTYDSTPDMFHFITFKGNKVLNIESEKK
jgi:hypothetical protein